MVSSILLLFILIVQHFVNVMQIQLVLIITSNKVPGHLGINDAGRQNWKPPG